MQRQEEFDKIMTTKGLDIDSEVMILAMSMVSIHILRNPEVAVRALTGGHYSDLMDDLASLNTKLAKKLGIEKQDFVDHCAAVDEAFREMHQRHVATQQEEPDATDMGPDSGDGVQG